MGEVKFHYCLERAMNHETKDNDSNHIEISCRYFANLGKSIHTVTDHNLGLLIQDWPQIPKYRTANHEYRTASQEEAGAES